MLQQTRENGGQPSSLLLNATAGLLICLTLGCGTASPLRPGFRSQQIALNDAPDALAEEIRDFVEYFQNTVEHAAVELERKAATSDDRRAAILFRTRLVSQCRAAADQHDPKESLLDLWALSQRTLDYLSAGAGKSAFGERQPIALEAAKSIHVAIEQIARRCVTPDSFEHVRETVRTYAAEHPMAGDFTKPPARNLSDEPRGEALQELVGLPLAPLTALAGVSRTPDSIRSVSRSVDRFAEVAEDFPANVRWQLQLLAMNLGESPLVASTTGSFERLSESSTELAANSTEFVRLADELPERLGAQAQGVLDRLDASQPELRTTLEEANLLVESVGAASDRVRGSAVEIAQTVNQVRDASESLEKAADAVTVTAREILKFIPATMKDESGQILGTPDVQVVAAIGGTETPIAAMAMAGAGTPGSQPPHAQPGDVRPPDGSTPVIGGIPADPEDTSFSFQAVGRSAEALGQTADKLRDLLADLRTTLDGGTLSREVGALDGRWRDATQATSLQIQGVIDHAAKRAAQLVVLLFALLIGYRLLFRCKKGDKSN